MMGRSDKIYTSELRTFYVIEDKHHIELRSKCVDRFLYNIYIIYIYNVQIYIYFIHDPPAAGDLPIDKKFLVVLAAIIIPDSLNMTKRLYQCFTVIQDAVTRAVFGVEMACKKAHFYELVDRNMKGEQVLMSTFKGSILCIVNIASK
jgi:hypothetical protein